MVSLNNKDFLKLLDKASLEMNYINEVQILSEQDEEFYFTYDVSKNTISEQGEIKLSREQYLKICELAYNHYQENAPENTEAEFSPDYYSLYGVNRQMFI